MGLIPSVNDHVMALWEIIHTLVPLLPSSVILYWTVGNMTSVIGYGI